MSGVPYGTQAVAYTYTATQACTVKSIKLDTGVVQYDVSDNGNAVIYALVVVREGYNANSIVCRQSPPICTIQLWMFSLAVC